MTEQDEAWEAKAKRFAQMLADSSIQTNDAFFEIAQRIRKVLEILDDMEAEAREQGILEDGKEDLYAHRIREVLSGTAS